MRFGVGDFSGQRPPGLGPTHRDLYAQLLAQAQLIESAGLDSMWLSEHHFAEDGYMPAVIPIAAALLASTTRIVVATDRLAASLHDPIRLAEDAIALDLLSGGRFVLGLSLCYRAEELAGFGVEAASDVTRLERAVSFLRGAFRFPTAVIEDRSVHVTPRPVTVDGPPIMIAADGRDGADRAARLADLMMVDPTEPWSAVDEAVARFDEARSDDRGGLVIFTYGGLAESGPDSAWEQVAAGFAYMRHNYDRWMGRPLTAELPPKHYRLLLGTPEQVAEQAAEYRSRYGDRIHLVLRCNYPGMEDAAVTSQISLWGVAAGLARATGVNQDN